jgi:putative thioredoxin
MATESAYVYDVDEETFERDVLERSATVPVVVDFWAPWCGPCRMLGPALERLAGEHQGQFELAKLNIDENPAIAQAFHVQSIPAVKAFKDGKLVSEFTGALPESRLRAFLAKVLPSEADALARKGEELLAAGHQNAAEDAFRSALEKDSRHAAATVGLARVLAGQGEEGEAEALRLLSTLPNDARAAQLKAEIGLRSATEGVDRDELEARLEGNSKDVDAHYRLGMALAAEGRYEEALDHLLDVVRLDRSYGEDAGRKAMLDVFNLLGDENPITQGYRRQLSRLLF